MLYMVRIAYRGSLAIFTRIRGPVCGMACIMYYHIAVELLATNLMVMMVVTEARVNRYDLITHAIAGLRNDPSSLASRFPPLRYILSIDLRAACGRSGSIK